MKKYILAFLILFIPCVTHAITMCARNDTLVGSLNPVIDNNAKETFSYSEPYWRLVTSFGTIFGESTKLSAAEGGEPSGQYSLTNTDGKMIPMDTQAGLVGDDANGNPREYCWCRMTHPMVSRWVSPTPMGYATCNNECAHNIRYRTQLFGAIMFRSVFTLLADED